MAEVPADDNHDASLDGATDEVSAQRSAKQSQGTMIMDNTWAQHAVIFCMAPCMHCARTRTRILANAPLTWLAHHCSFTLFRPLARTSVHTQMARCSALVMIFFLACGLRTYAPFWPSIVRCPMPHLLGAHTTPRTLDA